MVWCGVVLRGVVWCVVWCAVVVVVVVVTRWCAVVCWSPSSFERVLLGWGSGGFCMPLNLYEVWPELFGTTEWP